MSVSHPSAKTVRAEMVALTSSQVGADPNSLRNIEEIFDGLEGLKKISDNESDSAIYRVLIKFNESLLLKEVEHSFKPNELVAWIAIEIMNTGVDLCDIAPWLCHEPTLDEIVFGDDATSLLSLFTSRKDKNNRRRFRAMLRTRGLSRRSLPPQVKRVKED